MKTQDSIIFLFSFPQKLHSSVSSWREFSKRRGERKKVIKITDREDTTSVRNGEGSRVEGTSGRRWGVKHRGRGFSHPPSNRVVVRVINGGNEKKKKTKLRDHCNSSSPSRLFPPLPPLNVSSPDHV